jgi:hypothetical protein
MGVLIGPMHPLASNGTAPSPQITALVPPIPGHNGQMEGHRI